MTQAKAKFKVGQVYGQHLMVDKGNVEGIRSVVSQAYEVVSRTAKYITVRNVTPYSSEKGAMKRFFVNSVKHEGLEDHEYFAQYKSPNIWAQNRIHSYDLLDASELSRLYNELCKRQKHRRLAA